jgi:hypothetical protein
MLNPSRRRPPSTSAWRTPESERDELFASTSPSCRVNIDFGAPEQQNAQQMLTRDNDEQIQTLKNQLGVFKNVCGSKFQTRTRIDLLQQFLTMFSLQLAQNIDNEIKNQNAFLSKLVTTLRT